MKNLCRSLQKCSLAALLLGLAASASAQQGSLENEYPELLATFHAIDVTQAAIFDAVAEINADPSTMTAQQDLRRELMMMANMTMSEMMAAGMGHGGMEMGMTGPYGELEAEARSKLGALLRSEHSERDARRAYGNSRTLTDQAAQALAAGREFESALYDIFAAPNMSLDRKRTLVNSLVDAYLSSDKAMVAEPKPASLYLESEFANGFKAAFPRINGLMWSNQWLKLAALEAIILGQVDDQFAGGVPTTLERYWNKVGSGSGMSMFPAPSEMPSVPAIAPQLFSQAPRAAIIIDNLNMMRTALADAVAYPAQDEREEAMELIVAKYTSSDAVTDEEDYLLSALRGGIYNQGGPALGELGFSERNRSREEMDMIHTRVMSVPSP
jgi:hypothetical protein